MPRGAFGFLLSLTIATTAARNASLSWSSSRRAMASSLLWLAAAAFVAASKSRMISSASTVVRSV